MKAKLMLRAASAVSTLALLAGSVAPVAVAGVTGSASNDTTGAGSSNKTVVEVEQSTTVVQDNWAEVNNEVGLQLNTGHNRANKNTGAGDVSTGDAVMGVGISNSVNSNAADISGCGGCDLDLEASNGKTGADSWNKAKVKVSKDTEVFQDNYAEIFNGVKANLNTGRNQASKNTGDGQVVTGDIEATAIVENQANGNVAVLGSGSGVASLSATNDTTGADSSNLAKVKAELGASVVQDNWAEINNEVALEANTGRNRANKNTGAGDVSTGDIGVGVGLNTQANTNFLAYDGCCDVELDTQNTKTGADSDNQAKAVLYSSFSAFQSNCGWNFPRGFGSDWLWWLPECHINNQVSGALDTGNNETSKNTSDLNESGDIDAVVQAETDANENMVGDLFLSAPDFDGDVEFPGFGGNMAWWMLFWGMLVG